MEDFDFFSLFSCLFYLVLLVIVFLLAGWSVNYLAGLFLLKTVPFFVAMLIGIFIGEVTIPVAITIYLLKLFGAI